jgi:hypothetical protein
MVSAVLALSELVLSGVRMPSSVMAASLALFALSAIAEGAITLAVVGALEAIQPDFVRQPVAGRSFALGAVALLAVVLVTGGVLFASSSPDGIQKLGQAKTFVSSPLAGYTIPALGAGWMAKAAAGLAGLGLVYGACVLAGRKR